MKTSFLKYILILTALSLIVSCAYQVDKTQSDFEQVDSSVQKGNYGYEQVKRNVLDSSCVGCHATKNPILLTYAQVKAALPKIVNAVFVEKSMPPKGIKKIELAILKKWIADGAPEVVNNPSPDPGTQPIPSGRPILWSQFKQLVFEKQCLNCHFKGNKDGISDYSDINIVRASIPTAMYLTLVTKQMPPPPVRLSLEESDAFSRWIFDGMRDDNGTPAPPPPAN